MCLCGSKQYVLLSVCAESEHSAPLCCSSVTTARRRPCTTAAGTPPTAPSSVSRSTGTPTTNEPAAGRDEQTLSPSQPYTVRRYPPLLSVSIHPTHTLSHTHTRPSGFVSCLPEKLCGRFLPEQRNFPSVSV